MKKQTNLESMCSWSFKLLSTRTIKIASAEFHWELHEFDLMITQTPTPPLKLWLSQDRRPKDLFKFFFSWILCSIWDSNHVDLQRKRTLSCIYLAWFIRCILKNRGVNFLLNEWPWFLFCIGAFFLVDFSWNFNRVNLQGKKTVLSISLAWILCCYIINRGVNFLLFDSEWFFGMLLQKKIPSETLITSISKEKGHFHVFI